MSPSPPPPAPPSPSKPIEKRTLHSGRPGAEVPDYKDGTRVRFHFVTKRGEQQLV